MENFADIHSNTAIRECETFNAYPEEWISWRNLIGRNSTFQYKKAFTIGQDGTEYFCVGKLTSLRSGVGK